MKRDGDADGSTGAESPDESRELEAFAEDLRSAFPHAPVEPASQQAHLVAMMEAAQLLADKGGSTVRSTSNAQGPERQASGLPKLRRRPVFKSLAAKITAVAVVVTASLGGLATAGALPRAVQHGVATAANAVGIDLPDPNDQDDEGDSNDQTGDEDESGDQGEGDSEDPTDEESPDAVESPEPVESEDSDDQGDDQDDANEADEQDDAESEDSDTQTGGQEDGDSEDSSDQSGDQDNGDESGDQSDDQSDGDQSGDSGSGDQSSDDND